MSEYLEMFSVVCLENISNDILQQLRMIIHSIQSFDQIDSCEEYLRTSSKNERIILLVNEQFAQDILSRIHDLRQLIAVYIHVDDLQDPSWKNDYKKVGD